MNTVNVTRSSMPDFEEYCAEIRDIWDSHWLTNMGVKHRQLESDLTAYLHTPNLKLYVNGNTFYPVAYKLYWEDGQIQHRAELHDMGANCILSVNLLQLEDNNE